jgi:hypothetical protein
MPPVELACPVEGCARVQVMEQRIITVEKSQETFRADVHDVFQAIDKLRYWIMGLLATVITVGGGAVLALVLRK